MKSTSLFQDAALLDEETVEFAAKVFSALSHPTRLRMVEALTARGLTVGEIASRLCILQPNASQHLAILQRAGVVRVTPNGAQRVYAIRGPRIARILMLVQEFQCIHADSIVDQPAKSQKSLKEATVS